MPSTARLSLHPDNVSDADYIPNLICQVHDQLKDAGDAVYGQATERAEVKEGFIARTPEHALRWVCKRVSRPKLLRVIQRIYDFPDGTQEAVLEDADPERHVETGPDESSTESVGSKRKRTREKTTRQVNKELVNRMNEALVQTVASSQDRESIKAPEGLSIDERRYRNFVTKMPGIGVQAAAAMIAKATAVGSMEVFEDWSAIFEVWKRQNMYGKKLFQGVAVANATAFDQDRQVAWPASQETRAETRLILSQHPGRDCTDEAGLTYMDTQSFRLRYFDAQKTQVDGIADDMRHRWKMDELYEDFERLEKEVRSKAQGTGGRGRRYDAIAKEHLFAKVYEEDLGRAPNKSTDAELWTTFGNYLDIGKRWNIIKKRFGSVGIFGLLPRSMVANTFVEKQMSQTRVAQWAEMIAECNSDVALMAIRIEPLFIACMGESEPPAEFAFLNQLNHFQGAKPLDLFDFDIEAVDASERRRGGVFVDDS